MPFDEQKDCEVFIIPEKIYDIIYVDKASEDDLFRKLEMLRNLTAAEIASNLAEGRWRYYTIFKRFVSAIKEYCQLRPNVIERYPEYLI